MITGLLGILPQVDDNLIVSPIIPSNWTYFIIENLLYHGHLVTVLYDKDGSRYEKGSGLTVFIDGESVYNTRQKSAKVPIPPLRTTEVSTGDTWINIAANPLGLSEQYPKADATFTYEADWVYKAIDGVLYYDRIPDNRWTNFLSPNINDTVTVTFARPRNISSVTLALYSDIERGGSIDLPARIEVYGDNHELLATVVDASDILLANDRNEIRLDKEVETLSVAVNMFRKSEDLWVGICELEVWVPPPTTKGVYYAVDAHIEGKMTKVLFDGPRNASIATNNTYNGFSRATPNGAVIGGLAWDSNISFAGIVGPDNGREQPVAFEIGYLHTGDIDEILSVEINHDTASARDVSLAPTVATEEDKADDSCQCSGGFKYGKLRVEDVRLGVGRNWVVLKGSPMTGSGTDDRLRIETLTVLY